VSEPASQRAYRAACPGCGAPVEFRSAQSTHAVCGYCQSTIVREGETLRRLGKMAEVFNDYSPLQLLASGRWQSIGFVVVGRLQYQYGQTRWSEWQLAFDDGTTGSLSEDNGAFVLSRPVEAQRELPAPAQLRVGAGTAIDGQRFTITANETVSLLSAQGELGHLPPLGQPFAWVELRSDDGQVLSIDYGHVPPALSRGREVRLDELELKGLKDESARDDRARAFNCPNCGATVEVNLAASQSITCRSCNALIDLTQGIGGELRHAEQDEPVRPLIPLGSTGKLQGVDWQVVGFQHRMGHEPGDDEHFGWNEYLLFNAKRGFSFLVDAEDGWSQVKPTTGAPQMAPGGQSATYLGTRYQQLYAYEAETTYVAGEFYWPVVRGQRSFNRDYAAGRALLSMEQTPRELTWSSGSRLDSALVAQAFKLDARKDLFKRADASPVSTGSGLGCGTLIVLLIIIVIVLALMRSCSQCDPRYENCSSSSTGYRSSGGSWGGYSSGGGHK
jgi:ribosomal protein S27E